MLHPLPARGPRAVTVVTLVTLLAVVSTGRSAAQTPVELPTRNAPPTAPSVAPPTATAPATAPTSPAGALTFSLGTEPCGLDRVLGRCTHGVVAQLGYERRIGRAVSPFAVRVVGDYWRTGSYAFTPQQGLVPDPITYTRRSKLYGGSVLGVYQLPFALGPVRPYALGGVGVYQYAATTEAARSSGGQRGCRLTRRRLRTLRGWVGASCSGASRCSGRRAS